MRKLVHFTLRLCIAAMMLLVGGSVSATCPVGGCKFEWPAKSELFKSWKLMRCAHDRISSFDQALARARWAFRCGLLDEDVWEYYFTTREDFRARERVQLQGQRYYPMFTVKDGDDPTKWPVWNVEAETAESGVWYQKCDIPANVVYYDYCLNGS